jgi:hypothetical protein
VVATHPTNWEQVEHVFSTFFPTPLGEWAGVLLNSDGGVHRGGSMQYSGTRRGRNRLRTLFLWWEPGVGVDADEQAVGEGLSYSHWQQGRIPLTFW